MSKTDVFSYVEIIIEACNGDTTKLDFDRGGSFREKRTEANQALVTLSMVGMGGKPFSEYRKDREDPWFEGLPDDAHLIRIEVNKANHLSGKRSPFAQREYECVHTKAAQ